MFESCCIARRIAELCGDMCLFGPELCILCKDVQNLACLCVNCARMGSFPFLFKLNVIVIRLGVTPPDPIRPFGPKYRA